MDVRRIGGGGRELLRTPHAENQCLVQQSDACGVQLAHQHFTHDIVALEVPRLRQI